MEEQKKTILAKDTPPTLEGMNLDVFAVLGQALRAASDYGYDPENDYRKQTRYSCSTYTFVADL
jgi:hypothetical protein